MNLSSLTSNTSGYSSKGFSGLASGIDTESMVEAMLSGTQSKIDKQYGLKQQTLWKQEIYRSLIKTINSFQSKYFSSSSSTNFLSSTYFNLMNAVSNSSKFKVNATSSATSGSTKIHVDQLATNTKITSGAQVSGKLEGTYDIAKINDLVQQNIDADRTVTFKYDGEEVVVDLRDCFIDAGGDYTTPAVGREQAIANAITQAFDDAGYGEVTAEVKSGTLTITSTDKTKTIGVLSASSSEGLKALGLTAGRMSSTSGDKVVLSSTLNTNCEITLDVTLDDNKKSIGLNIEKFIDSGNVVNMGRLVNELQEKVDKAHGVSQITVFDSGTSLEFKVNNDSRKVLIGGSASTLSAFGFKNGQSNRIGMGGELKDLYFATPLQGGNYKFTINGVKFDFDDTYTMSEIINKVNSSDAGVRITYKTLEDKFVIEATNSGKGHNIDMSQDEGNLLNAMFGKSYWVIDPDTGLEKEVTLSSGNTVTSTVLYKNNITSKTSYYTTNVDEGTFTMKVNGTTHTFAVDPKSDGTPYTIDDLVFELNSQFDAEFGAGVINFDIASPYTLNINDGMQVSFVDSGLTSGSGTDIDDALIAGNLNLAFGFGIDGETNNVADKDTMLSELGITGNLLINGTTIDPTTTTLEDLTTTNFGVDRSFDFNNGRLTYTGTNADTDFGNVSALETLFGVSQLNLAQAQGNATDKNLGQNALVYIDDAPDPVERSSNSFSFNGINIELTSTHTKNDLTDYDIIEVSRGVDTIVDGIKSFIADYNAMIEEINDLIRQDTNYKSYAPLTDAQKKEMSDREIELWEEKAKEGLLRNDSTLSAFLSSMRTALYEKPNGALYAIYDLGIETSSDWKDYGKLVLSTDGEAKLRQALEANPDEVIKLFTDPDEGIAVKLNKICKDAANTSAGSPGTLVQIAGSETKATQYNNELYTRMKAIDDKIAVLQRTYEKEKSRYWRQFNAMESLISEMNSQSSWLYYQLGS